MATAPTPIVIDYVMGKPKNPLTFRERFLEIHLSAVEQGASGPFLLFIASMTSTVVLIWNGCTWLVRKCRGG